jgi:hypothetical protein
MTPLEKFEKVNNALTEYELHSVIREVLQFCTTDEFHGLLDLDDATVAKQLLNHHLFMEGKVSYQSLTTSFGIRTHAIYLRYHKKK